MFLSKILSFFDGAYKVKTTIKLDDSSKKMMESLVNSSFYSGNVSLFDGYFIPKGRFLSQTQIYLSTSKDNFYVLRNDQKFMPLRYRLFLSFIVTLVFCIKPMSNGAFYLFFLVPSFFWLITRISRFILRDGAALFLERYYHFKNEYEKHKDFPNSVY